MWVCISPDIVLRFRGSDYTQVHQAGHLFTNTKKGQFFFLMRKIALAVLVCEGQHSLYSISFHNILEVSYFISTKIPCHYFSSPRTKLNQFWFSDAMKNI